MSEEESKVKERRCDGRKGEVALIKKGNESGRKRSKCPSYRTTPINLFFFVSIARETSKTKWGLEARHARSLFDFLTTHTLQFLCESYISLIRDSFRDTIKKKQK